MTRKKRAFCGIVAAVLLLCTLALIRSAWEVSHPEITEREIACASLPAAFDDLTVLQVSDLHGRYLSDEAFWDPILEKEPDLIALTGDVLSRGSDEAQVEALGALLERFAAVSPVYWVGGNHEAESELWERVSRVVEAAGGVALSDECVTLERDGASITVAGLRDPLRRTAPFTTSEELTLYALGEMERSFSEFTLLLAHRPEDAEKYAEAGADVVLSGHTHGGQIRLPLVGALFAPTQGLFPEYSAGLYTLGDTQLYVSRGLGGDLRLFCRPEIAFLTLSCA